MDNTHATHVLIEACRRHIPNVEFVHFSTDEVYGESKTDIPFTEAEGVLRPTNPYSASKAAAEMIVRSYIESFGMNIKIIRCNNVYGPNQYPEKLIPKFKRLLKEGKKCTIHGKNCANIKKMVRGAASKENKKLKAIAGSCIKLGEGQMGPS